jgi:3-dehydroquinate synthetase
MSQCDAAISHKQGINGHQGKNLVGTYYTPKLVAVDVETLATLPERLVSDGMAEVIKHAVGQDPGYVDFLLSNAWDVRDIDFIEQVVENNIRLKCDLVTTDPKELRDGMILQYGHTVGHAVEHLTGYKLYHGESVAVGMAVAAQVARIMGACNDALVSLHHTLLEKYKLPSRVPETIRISDVLDALRYSKKYLTEGTRMALLSDIGKLWSVDDDYAIPVSCGVLAEAIALTQEV